MVLWGVFLRVTLGLHATWLVNSATHLWGSRRFETRDDSRNNWWVALLTGGEGWHNNHHAHPVSARHGLRWYEIDPNFYGIWLLAKLGLARKIQVAKFDPANPKPAGLYARAARRYFLRSSPLPTARRRTAAPPPAPARRREADVAVRVRVVHRVPAQHVPPQQREDRQACRRERT